MRERERGREGGPCRVREREIGRGGSCRVREILSVYMCVCIQYSVCVF